jgi:hypothetical protein
MDVTTDQNCLKCKPISRRKKNANPDLHTKLKLKDDYLIAELYNQYDQNIESPEFPLTYQFTEIKYKWYRNGRYIKGAHDQILYIGDDTCENNYTVKVKYEVASIIIYNTITNVEYVINDNVNGDIVLNAPIVKELEINGDVSGTIVFNSTTVVASAGKLVINGKVFGQASMNLNNNSYTIDGIFINGNNECGGVDIIFNSSNNGKFLQISSGAQFDNYRTLTSPSIENKGLVNNYGPWILNLTLANNEQKTVNYGTFNNYASIFLVGGGILLFNYGKITNNSNGIISVGLYESFTGAQLILRNNSVFSVYGAIENKVSTSIEMYENSTINVCINNFSPPPASLGNDGSITLNDNSNVVLQESGLLFSTGSIILNNNSFIAILGQESSYSILGTFTLNDNSSFNTEAVNQTDSPTLISGTIMIGSGATLNIFGLGTLLTDPKESVSITNNGTITLYEGASLTLQNPDDGFTAMITNNGKIYLTAWTTFSVGSEVTYIGNSPIGSGTQPDITVAPIILSGKIYGKYVGNQFAVYGAITGYLTGFNFKCNTGKLILNSNILPVKFDEISQIDENSYYFGKATVIINGLNIDYCQSKIHLTVENPHIPLSLCCPTEYWSEKYDISDCVTFKFQHCC